MEDRKIIKMEKEVAAVAGGRLQSLKLPRDLSLGLKRKKQYQPNLNVMRNKDKSKDFLRKIEHKRKEKPSHSPRIKNDKFDSKRFIQSTSVFSHGTGDIKPKIPSMHRSGPGYRDSNSTNNLIKPTINRNSWPTNAKTEDFIIDELNNCDIDSDSDDEKSTFNALHLNILSSKKLQSEDIKQEHDNKLSVNTDEIEEPFDNSTYYDEDRPALGLLKLPDSFAGKGLSDDPNCKKLFDYPLEGMLEGQIGKLVIRKSGRMEIQIGPMRYHFEREVMNESKEQLATVVQSDNGESSLAFLGNITHNFVMYPDYEQF